MFTVWGLPRLEELNLNPKSNHKPETRRQGPDQSSILILTNPKEQTSEYIDSKGVI